MKHLKLIFACLLTAVFSIGQVWGADSYEKVTSAPSDWSGEYLLVYESSATAGVTWTGVDAKLCRADVVISDGVISTVPSGAVTLTIATMTGGYSIVVNGGTNDGKYIFGTSGSNKTNFGTTATLNTLAYDATNKCVTITSNTSVMRYNKTASTGEWFRYYKSSSYTSQQAVQLYKKAAGGGGSSDPSLSLSKTSLNLEASGNATQNITLTATNFTDAVNDVTCAFYNTAACDGAAISQPAWITNLTDNNSNQVSFNVVDNDGAARNVWMKITASKGTESASAILAISQKALVVDYAILPFSFDGGKADIETTNGMTQGSLDNSDYSASPKLKFKNQGSWVIIKINAAPGTLTYDIKGNSMSGTYAFDVEQSTDGETYSNVTTHTSLSGSKESKEFTLNQTTRFVRFIYTTKDGGNVGLGNIGISAYVAPAAVATPVISGDEFFVSGTEVSITCETTGAAIYYTTKESAKTTPATSGDWAAFNSASKPSFSETTTVWAAAQVGSDWSAVAEKTFNKVTALTTMDEIFAAATAAGSTATDVYITFDSWQISGVKNKNAFLTDGAKGAVIYSTSNSDFVENNVLSGTVACKVQLFKQFAEITSLTASSTGLTVATGSALTPVVKTIDQLSAVNTGLLVKVENLDYDGTSLSDGTNTIATFPTFYTPTLVAGKKYTITGVFQYYDGTKQLLPRSVDDIQLVTEKELASISLSGTYPTTFEQDDAFSHAGMVVTANYTDLTTEDVTASSTFTGYNMSATGEQTVTVHYSENATEVTETYTITVNAATPTGDWELFEGTLSELVAGDYLIYGAFQDKNCVMLGQVPSSGRFDFETATPDGNGIISNPSGYAVWTLAKSGDYWTFYNAKAGKYAAGNGVNNKGQMLVDGTSDYALWSISDEFVITNKGNLADEKNATLRHNATTTENYGFACYGATTGAKPVFYKPATPSYYITETLTGCTAADGNPTKVPQALTEDVVLHYNLSAGYAWPDAITVEVGGVELDPDDADYLWDASVSPAELTIDQTLVDGDIAVTIVAIERTLDNIAIAQAPTTTAYFVGDVFNPAGLQIQLNYTSGAPETVVYNDDTKAGFTFAPNLETALTTSDVSVEITYSSKSVSQAITVTEPTPDAKTVVIIAEYDSKFYAMSSAINSNKACPAIEVTKSGSNLVVTSAEDKAAIQWLMTTTGHSATIQDADDKYLSSTATSGDLAKADDAVNWSVTEDGGDYLIAIGSSRALLYRTSGIFKHYAKSNLESSPTEYFKISEFFEVAVGATNILVEAPEVHEFVVDPDEAVAFGTVEVGESVSAKSFDVTLTNIASATVTLSDDAAFSIDVTALTADGTITVTPNTANAGNFSATITLHDEANEAADKVINVTMKVVTPKDCDREDDFNTVGTNSSYLTRNSTDGWNAENTAVVSKDDVTYWMINGKTTAKGVITSPEFNYGIKQLSLDYYYSFTENNGISFKVEIKQSGSVVKTENITKADAVKGTVYSTTIEDINVAGKYQIVITNLCPSNSTSNADRFAIGNLCWKKYGEPVAEEVRSGLEANRYYTLCLGRKMAEVQGATFWSFAGKDASMAYIVQEEAPFEAGKPYIIYAETAGNLTAILDGKVTTTAGHNNGLYGTLSYMDADALSSAGATHMLKSNELRPIGSNNHLDANRAYVILAEISGGKPSNVPAHKVRGIPTQGTESQGVDNLNASETPVKMMIDGQLFIIRGEKMYDATGRLVK